MRKWVVGLGLSACLVGGAAYVAVGRIQPRVKARLEKLLADRFDSGVTVGGLSITLLPQATVVATNVELRYHHRMDVPPLIAIRQIAARSDLLALLFGVRHNVKLVRLEGLRITVPPHRLKQSGEAPGQQAVKPGGDRLPFVVEKINADGAVLVILPKEPGRVPLEWDISGLELRSVGTGRPMDFTASLRNAKPPGLIRSTGVFGPWQRENPGGTMVRGHYDFRNADLGVFKGISGVLSSIGDYVGSLDHIEVNGETKTPAFRVGRGKPVDLATSFSATVDGINGDTSLHPVDAKFLNSEFICIGGVTGTPSVAGKKIKLDVRARRARIEDILRLVMDTDDPPLVGGVQFQSKFVLPQGREAVLDRLVLDGQFGLRSAHFTSGGLQGRLDKYSGRSRGLKNPQEQPEVASNLSARFRLRNAVADFSRLSFSVPGIWVALTGDYGLASERINFAGTVQLQGRLSEMTTGWKSLMLRTVDPFFRRHGRTVIPVKIEGVRSDPKFELDLHRGRKNR